MISRIISVLLGGALMLNCGYAFAQSANKMMPGCRNFIIDQERQVASSSTVAAMKKGLCIGVVEGIAYAGSGICSPPHLTTGQALRVVVKYIDDRPAAQNIKSVDDPNFTQSQIAGMTHALRLKILMDRDRIAMDMTPAQIAEAQRLASAWRPER